MNQWKHCWQILVSVFGIVNKRRHQTNGYTCTNDYMDWCMHVSNSILYNISVISWWFKFIGGGNISTQKKWPTCQNHVTNYITTYPSPVPLLPLVLWWNSLIEGCCYQGSYWTKVSSWSSWSHHFESLTVMEYRKWPRICSTCRKHFPVISSFMTYRRVCN